MITKVNKYYTLTKTLILSGIQCEKKLWFDKNDKIKVGPKAIFEAGNRFNDIVRKHYGEGLDLSDEFDHKIAINKTSEAIKSDTVNVIYEGAFQYKETYIRADVLLKNNDSWTMLEAKASTNVKEINISDVAIQSYVIKQNGLNLNLNKLIIINKEFVYRGNQDYTDLIKEIKITNEVIKIEEEVEKLIENSISVVKKSCPIKEIGPHCKNPYPCNYFDRCSPPETDIQNATYKILPYHGKKIEKYCKENNIEKLGDIPNELLQSSRKDHADNYHYVIQQAHIKNEPWLNPELPKQFKNWKWPYYFMDFETVQQTIPVIKNTKPFDQLPFQWSIHKWNAFDQPLEEFSFLDFENQNIELNFIKKLIKTLGSQGTIFVHNHPFEKGILNLLKEKINLDSYSSKIDKIIYRIVDTLELTRKNFYSPKMFGKYSLKKIIKGIPTKISYESDEKNSVSDGGDAQLAWFKCTDSKTKIEDKENYKKELLKYCANDTKAMYDLILYFLNSKK